MEILDLTAYATTGDPADVPAKFCSSADPDPDEGCEVQPMHRARHFHTMTLLPDGKVAVTGGNRRGNADNDRDNMWNPCDVNGEFDVETDCIEPETCYVSRDCDDGCPSLCVQTQLDVPGGGATECVVDDTPRFSCSLIGAATCATATGCAAMTSAACADSDACHVVTVGEVESCVPTYTCDDLLEGAICVTQPGAEVGRCARPCDCDPDCDLADEFDACGDLMPYFDPDRDSMRCVAETNDPSGADGKCSPANNACYATKTAEIWDPACGAWTELDAELEPRMYHSTALLLPDARVLSMGGGHRGYLLNNASLREHPNGQYFAPSYAGADAPAFAGDPQPVTILYPGDDDQGPQSILLPIAAASEPVDHVALLKLGSVTHGFDMGQSFMKLDAVQTGNNIQLAESSDIGFPFNPNTAPPGYYMAFLMSAAGQPSGARYVRVTDAQAVDYVFEADAFAAQETSCTVEPESGACPSSGEATITIAAPTIAGLGATVSGFRVLAPAGAVADPDAPSAAELAALRERATLACTQYYDERDGQSANCSDPGAFLAPVPLESLAHTPVDFVHPDQRHGEGLFVDNTLDCDLGGSCYAGFDELLRTMANDRVTEAALPLGTAEEWRLSIDGDMAALASTGGSPVSASISGTIGYSLCAGGNDEAPCPFLLGSLEFELTEPLVLPMTCGSATVTHTLSSLSVRLGQPAFGIAEQGTAWKGFPAGALVVEAEGVVDSVPFLVRRPNPAPLLMRAGEAWTLLQGADGAWLEFSVPCGDDEASVLVWWGYAGVGVDAHPPVATIEIDSEVTCPSTVALDKSVDDDDDDLESVRWRVDGVLMDDGISSLTFTQAHELELVVRDARGATTVARKSVGCL